jgi:hypothetical protein
MRRPGLTGVPVLALPLPPAASAQPPLVEVQPEA